MDEAELHCEAAPRHRWQIGRYQVAYDHGRWGISDGSKGVMNHRTPLGAWLAFRRWQRTAPTGPVD
jgi:hypothetical protein